MNVPSTRDRPDDEILANIMQQLVHAEDRDALIKTYSQRYPHLATKIQELPSLLHMGHMLDDAKRSTSPIASNPKRLGEFRIVRLIGRGGMGDVYEAIQDAPLRRRVALKTIRRERMSDEAGQRFIREQGVLAHLHQTNIVPIHKAGKEGPLHYFAMPYIDGAALDRVTNVALEHVSSESGERTPTLAQLACKTEELASRNYEATESKAVRPMQFRLSAEYFRSVAETLAKVAEAVQYAHEARRLRDDEKGRKPESQLVKGQGILHRDLKPANIMVDTDGQPWIIDFGLAAYLKLADDEDSRKTDIEGGGFSNEPDANAASAIEANKHLLKTKGNVGTPNYMAPEQFANQNGVLDERTDVWALGVTLYELLTLSKAFPGQDIKTLEKQIRAEQPIRPRRIVRNVPRELQAICFKAIEKRPASRYRSAAEFAEDLTRWLRGEASNAGSLRMVRRTAKWIRRHKALTSLFVIIPILLAVVAAWGVEKHNRLVQTIQGIRFNTTSTGWSDDARELVRTSRVPRTANLRNQFAATLIGLDAKIVKRFQFSASSVAFSQDDQQLLLGGVNQQHANSADQQNAGVLWNSTSDELLRSQQAGAGPVTFAPDGTPLQLLQRPHGRLLLWNLKKQEAVNAFEFPNEGDGKSAPTHALNDLEYAVMALSPDGLLVAASANFLDANGQPHSDGFTAVWDVITGRVVHRFPVKANALEFSSDHSLLAAGGTKGDIRIWSMAKGNELASLTQGRSTIHGLAFARDSYQEPSDEADIEQTDWLLAAGGSGGSLRVWDLDAKEPRAFFHGSPYDVYTVAFRSDATLLASGGRTVAKIWDVATGRLILNLPCGAFLTDAEFSSDGTKLAVSVVQYPNWPKKNLLWDLQFGRGIQTLPGLASQIAQIRFSPNGDYLAALSHNWRVAIWDLRRGAGHSATTVRPARLVRVLEAPVGGTADNASLVFDADGNRFAFCSAGGARLWDVATGASLGTWELPRSLQDQMGFHPSGKLLLFRVETKDKKRGPYSDAPFKDHPRVCRIRELMTPNRAKVLHEIGVFNEHVYYAAAPNDASYFVVDGRHSGPKGSVRSVIAFDGLTGESRWKVASNQATRAGRIFIDPTAKLVGFYTLGQEQQMTLFDAVESKYLKTLECERPFVALQPDARGWAALGRDNKGFSIYRKGDKHPLITLGIDLISQSDFYQFSNDGNLFAWGNVDGTVSLCDLNRIHRTLAPLGLGW